MQAPLTSSCRPTASGWRLSKGRRRQGRCLPRQPARGRPRGRRTLQGRSSAGCRGLFRSSWHPYCHPPAAERQPTTRAWPVPSGPAPAVPGGAGCGLPFRYGTPGLAARHPQSMLGSWATFEPTSSPQCLGGFGRPSFLRTDRCGAGGEVAEAGRLSMAPLSCRAHEGVMEHSSVSSADRPTGLI